ncbi:hypothetical protein J2Z62_000003 [Mycoplasmoides fastidiosum]|uniref:Uncharacterized protein n=1 Tax=Mycoplasmoides fastidiosum TaxID=92758 RepID=A0ABU0LY03_9BACT|nr:hypothetical protein [Mycoplasmoides fastidiosum]MDQ0513565.1 hypothetical protein [Mycoplasmoides fastidiosum]UUD38012.1 hypothetical protein NPA10_01295 [Mycoplasmoides fastidiosum]
MNSSPKRNWRGNFAKLRLNSATSFLIGLAILTSSTVALTASLYFVSQAYQKQVALEQQDPVQTRLARFQATGMGDTNPVDSSQNNHDDVNLSAFVGRDLADLENFVIENTHRSISFQGDLPKTGIKVVSTNVSLTQTNGVITVANAYDYVNLKYVQYNPKTKEIKNVKYAPPLGLFSNNETENVWPTLETSGNELEKFFPTRTIRTTIAALLNKSPDGSFTKQEWFDAFDKPNMTLDLSNLGLSSIAEIFNPNLRWGLGIYDLKASITTNPNFEIRYSGIGTINVDDNFLTHFPNPNYKNFPGLKTIQASRNQIEAIGDFNTFSNNHYSTEFISDEELKSPVWTAPDNQNYYQYLSGLWADNEVKDLAAVQGIKTWITQTLAGVSYAGPTASSSTKTGTKTVNDYTSFLDAVSADPLYFKNKDGTKFVNQTNPTTTNNNNNGLVAGTDGLVRFDPNAGIRTNSDGIVVMNIRNEITFDKGTNFGAVRLDINKDIARIDFSSNRIERIPLSKNMFTHVKFNNNRLRYITPIAAKPLPWFNHAAYFNNILTNEVYTQYFNPTNWAKYYDQTTENLPRGWNRGSTDSNDNLHITRLKIGNENFTLPTFSFYDNQLLDFWPQQDTESSWYTWPKLTIPTSNRVQGAGANVNSNVNGYPIGPWNHKIGDDANPYYPWFHRTAFGPTSAINRNTTAQFSTYLGVFGAGSFLFDIAANETTRTASQNLYGIFFNQLNDNKALTYLQRYNKSIDYNVTLAQQYSDPFILPGFNSGSDVRKIGTTSDSGTVVNNEPSRKIFDDRILSNASDAYKSYNSQVPYILTRTLPQNHSVANSWGKQDGRSGNGQTIQASLVNDQGEDVTPTEFKNIDWVSFYAQANGLNHDLAFQDLPTNYEPSTISGTPTGANAADTNNGNRFLLSVLGQMPYLNGRKNARPWTSGSSNIAQGLGNEFFYTNDNGTVTPKTSTLTLNISAPLQQWNYTYTINVLTDTTYFLNPINPSQPSAPSLGRSQQINDNSGNRTLDISQTNFNKKHYFVSSITASDLINGFDEWAVADRYVSSYIANDNTSVFIRSFDQNRNQLVVGFNVFDPLNNQIKIADITLTNFAVQEAFLISDSNEIVTDFDDRNRAPNTFAPKDTTAALAWIKNHLGVRWIGLAKNSANNGGNTTVPTTTTGANAVLNNQNIYKLDQLDHHENYLTGIFFDKIRGTLSFTLQIGATAANGGINLVRNYTINSFKKLEYSIDSTNVANDLSALDYTDDKLKEFVTLKTFQTINGTEENVQTKKWSEAISDNQLDTYLPPETELGLVDVNRNGEIGSVDFAVVLREQNNSGRDNFIDFKQTNFFNLSNFNSTFAWKQNNDNLSGIAFIPYNQYQDQQVSAFKAALLAAADQAAFSQLILPLLDLSATAPTFGTDKHLTATTQELSMAQKNQLLIGFHAGANWSQNDINNNITTIADANLVSINSLTIKGGYRYGKFYAGTDQAAPITTLPSLLVALKPNLTTTQAISDAYKASATPTNQSPTSGYTGGGSLFHHALSQEWKDLLPSEWLTQLRVLKNLQLSQSSTNLDYTAYDNLTGFLNHVLTTSTSNPSYGTTVDINNLGGISVNNSTGEVVISANTLLINNSYTNNDRAERNLVVQPYQQEIRFFLDNYFNRISGLVHTEVKLPFTQNALVNRSFGNESVIGIMDLLNELLTKAQKLYDALDNNQQLTVSEQLAATDAINILKFRFIDPLYYANPDADQFFVTKFGTNDVPNNQVGKMTQFKTISFTNQDHSKGQVDIKVVIENYIQGLDGTHFRLGDQEQTFHITNALSSFLLPTWKNYNENSIVIATDDPSLTSLEGQNVAGTIVNDGFKKYAVKEYYDQLITKTNPDHADYISLTNQDQLFDLVTWSLVDNSGININPNSVYYQTVFNNLKASLTNLNLSFNVRKSDIQYSEKNEQIYLFNPFLSFNPKEMNLSQVQLLSVIFDPNKTKPNLIDPQGNYQNVNLNSVILQGFKRQPLLITRKDDQASDFLINFDNEWKRANQLTGSEILSWLKANSNQRTKINNFLQSFFNVQGFSRADNPLLLVLNPALLALLAQDVPAAALNQFLEINEGLGEFSFLANSIQVVNSYQLPDLNIHAEPINITTFLANQQTAPVTLTNLQLVNTQVLANDQSAVTNGLISAGVNQDIRAATNSLASDNFALAYRYLQLSQAITSDTTNQRLVITGIHSDLAAGQIIIDYEIQNAFVNGKIMNLQKQYVITGFNSNSNNFLTTHLPWIIVLILIAGLGLYYGIWRHQRTTNSIKYAGQKRTKVRLFRTTTTKLSKKNK